MSGFFCPKALKYQQPAQKTISELKHHHLLPPIPLLLPPNPYPTTTHAAPSILPPLPFLSFLLTQNKVEVYKTGIDSPIVVTYHHLNESVCLPVSVQKPLLLFVSPLLRSRLSTMYALVALGAVLGLLLMAAAVIYVFRATLMIWITGIVLLTFFGKPRRVVVAEGRKLMVEITGLVMKILIT